MVLLFAMTSGREFMVSSQGIPWLETMNSLMNFFTLM